jgi:DNA invertase Pin-like site-specific DNA recombinase
MVKIVSYSRVSTRQQGESGLGIAAQLRAIRDFARNESHEIIRPDYVEVQSGAKDDRPQLAEAVKQCRLYGATLVVAKADRLTRTGETVSQFAKRHKIAVIALDNVNGDDVFAILSAAVGSVERKLISKRTRDALQSLKAQGKALGGYRGVPPRDYASKLGLASVRANMAQRAADLAPIIDEIVSSGMTSDRAVADELNRRGIVTARGGKWHGATVKAVRAA